MSNRLKDKVAVVTGSGRGIGREYALALAAEGARIVVNDLAPRAGEDNAAEAVVAELRALGTEAIADHADVTDPAAVEAMMNRAAETFGRLDIVVANAGIIRPNSIEEMTGTDWAQVMAVHVNGTYNCIHSAVPHLRRAGGGSVITTGSLATELLFPGLASYRSAKAAIVVLTNYAAEEFRDANINVNSIMPGGTVTRMSDTFYASLAEDNEFLGSSERQQQQGAAAPVPDASPADTVPPLGVYLCTDEGRSITGAAFQLSDVGIGLVTTGSEMTYIRPEADRWTTDALVERIPAWITEHATTAS